MSSLPLLIKRRGKLATYSKSSTKTYSAATGSASGDAPVTYPIKAYFSNYELKEARETSKLVGTRRVVFTPYDVDGNPLPEPDNDDRITGVGDTIVISNIQKIYNGETLVCYICYTKE